MCPRRFELSRRRGKLSLQHHAEVASLPVNEQEYWLDQAEQHGWSRNHFRNILRERAQGERKNISVVSVMSLVEVLPEHVER